jgi:hypothetical protein
LWAAFKSVVGRVQGEGKRGDEASALLRLSIAGSERRIAGARAARSGRSSEDRVRRGLDSREAFGRIQKNTGVLGFKKVPLRAQSARSGERTENETDGGVLPDEISPRSVRCRTHFSESPPSKVKTKPEKSPLF